MKNIIIAIIIFLSCVNCVLAQDTVIHESLEINPNIELLMAHEYYKHYFLKLKRFIPIFIRFYLLPYLPA